MRALAQLRGTLLSSSGKTLMANGIEMFLASKKSALFSQYRRPEESPCSLASRA